MLLRAGDLVERQPLRPLGANRRRVIVTREIDAVLNSNAPYFPRSTAEGLIGRFIAGQFITISRRRETEADFKLVIGVDEVWSMCFRTPRPGGRLLGRFAEPDIFVGLGLHLREELGGARYLKRAEEVVGAWNDRLGTVAPFRSANNLDYLNYVSRDLDEDDE